ncbi:hypothetical protein AVR82_08775 [Lactiplantibacillus plantarum]|uniref:hypothetical protein n=1 Tax=Lactiplantibacillus plantarum TaxID=1590 RepID=UPI00081C84A2|nr:hypothetical protein [Lactiplantibacillus plantarum]AOB19712.1 hypothetical protein AVR82_08775 [Lactiplantibacillus plantarum]AOB23372.1 hypothetical protein AVR83_10590 [Lactiplantibacillus plantarum]
MSVINQTHKRYLKDDDGNVYWPMTSVDSVIGLAKLLPVVATDKQDGLMSAADKQKINNLKEYGAATDTTEGLLSASDKQKLDSLKAEPIDAIRIKDSVTGTIFKLSISNGAVSVIKDDVNG